MSTQSFKIVNQFLECRVGFLWGNWPFWFSWWFSLYLGPRPYVEACPVFTAFQDFRPWFNFPWKTLGHFRKIDERIKNWGTLKASFLNNHAITCNGLLIEIKKIEFHCHPSWNRACTYDGFLYRLSSLSICVTISDLSDSPHHREKSEFLSRLYGITAVKFVALRALVRWLAWFLSIYCPVSFEFILVSSFNIFLDRLVSMLSLFYRIGTKKFLSSHSRFKGPGSTRILYRMVLI